jgi:hypothetical protein
MEILDLQRSAYEARRISCDVCVAKLNVEQYLLPVRGSPQSA